MTTVTITIKDADSSAKIYAHLGVIMEQLIAACCHLEISGYKPLSLELTANGMTLEDFMTLLHDSKPEFGNHSVEITES